MSGLRRALIGLAIAGLALGLAALALVTASDRDDDSTAWIVLALTLGWGFEARGSSRGGGVRRTGPVR